MPLALTRTKEMLDSLVLCVWVMVLYWATDHRAHVSGAAAGTRPDSWSHLGPLGLLWGFAPSLFGVLFRVCCGLSLTRGHGRGRLRAPDGDARDAQPPARYGPEHGRAPAEDHLERGPLGWHGVLLSW